MLDFCKQNEWKKMYQCTANRLYSICDKIECTDTVLLNQKETITYL